MNDAYRTPSATLDRGGPSDRAFVRSYTVGLFAVSVLCLCLLGFHVIVVPGVVDRPLATSRMLAYFYGVVGAVSAFVGYLRAAGSAYARAATLALNALWAVWIGVGTAMLIWWLVRVRKAERTAAEHTPGL